VPSIDGLYRASGSREYFGALLLGAYKGRTLQYLGKVGTGFDRKNPASLYRTFQPLKRKNAAIESLPHGTFLSPRLIAQVSYTELTKDGKLRHPVFLGLRDDKDAKDVSLPT
jgi:bifunctional non-homologous end joining protein LigD